MSNAPAPIALGASHSPIEIEDIESGVAAAVAREQQEIQAAIITAKKFPRDETEAFTKAKKSAERASMAGSAAYSFKRAGTEITGPSIDAARELARCWKNIRYGLRIVKMSKEMVHIKGFAYDCEANSYVEAEDEFQKKIQRKIDGTTKWIDPDERDLRELINRRGAICVRNAILQVLPPDYIDEFLSVAHSTNVKVANGQLSANREDVIRQIAYAFAKFGVTNKMLEDKLGHVLSTISEKELVQLRDIYKSIVDSNSQVHEHFDTGESRGEAAEVTAKLKKETEKMRGEKLPNESEGQ